MDVRGLGYIGVDVGDVDAWREYAELLGTTVVARSEGLAMKIDDRPFRVVVRPADTSEGLAFAGWELPDAAAMEICATELESAGFAIDRGSAAECDQRRVRGLISTTDPGGFTVELFHGVVHDHEPFVSPTGVSGFTTGEQGMGHIVLGTPDIEGSSHFYTDVLGFRVSDYWKPGGSEHDVVFLHCNPRHHSLALVPAGEPALYHFMLEMTASTTSATPSIATRRPARPSRPGSASTPTTTWSRSTACPRPGSRSRSAVVDAASTTPPGPSPNSPSPASGATDRPGTPELARRVPTRRSGR